MQDIEKGKICFWCLHCDCTMEIEIGELRQKDTWQCPNCLNEFKNFKKFVECLKEFTKIYKENENRFLIILNLDLE